MRTMNTIGAVALAVLLLPMPAAAAPANTPGPPYTPDGDYDHPMGTSVIYCAVSTDPDGDPIQYVFHWGDDTPPGVTQTVPSGTEGCATHVWSFPGEYCVTVYAQDLKEPVPERSPCRTETVTVAATPFDDTGDVQPVERTLLHEEDVTVAPSQDLPPEDVEGIVTPDYPGTDPVPTPGVDQPVATVTVRDEGPLVCVDVMPAGGGAIEVTCLDRAFLGPADGLVARGDTPVVFVDEDDTPDVPGTDPVPVQDVDPIPAGSLGRTPHVTMTLDASYHYDPGRLRESARLLGQSFWSPVAPGSEAWYVEHGGEVDLSVTVSIYEDGVHRGTVPVSVPYLGQAIAAAEKTAGTL